MAMKNIFNILVDLKFVKKSIEQPLITQNDSVVFVLEVMEDGVPFDLTDTSTVSLAHTRKDQTVVVTPGTKLGNKATFELGTNETSVTGAVTAKAQFYDADGRVSTLSFAYQVGKDPTGSEYVPSDSEQTLIEVVLNDGPLIIASAEEAATYANEQGDYALQVGVANETRYLNAVSTVVLRDSTYPLPAHGDTVRITELGRTDRYVLGTGWVTTDVYNPVVIDEISSQVAEKALKTEVRANTTIQPINVAEMDTETKQLFTGGAVAVVGKNAVDTENLKRKAVTPNEMEYIPLPAIQTRNLFDKRKYTPNSILNAGVIVANPYPEFDFAVTHFIPVEPGQNYVRTNADTLAFYDVNKIYISTPASAATHLVPINAYYVRYVFSLAAINTVQFEKGTVKTSYVEFAYKLDSKTLENGVIEEKHLKEKYVKNKIGKNLFDKTKITTGQYVVWGTGLLSANATYAASDFMEIEPNTQYSKTGTQQFAYYDANKVYISGVGVASTFTTPANAKYIRLSFLLVDLEQAQFEKGPASTGYEPYTWGIDPVNYLTGSIEDKHLKSVFAKTVKGKNLFDKAARTSGKYVAYTTGALVTSTSYFATDFMACEPLTQYTKNDTQQLAFYNANKVYISGLASATTFTTPADCYFMRVTAPDGLIDFFQVEKGAVQTALEPFGYYINPAQLQKGKVEFEDEMELQIPSTLHLIVGEEFSIYWRNVVRLSSKLKTGDYYIRVQKVTADVYAAVGEDYGDKWSYKPTAAETFNLEIRLYHTYRAEIVEQKTVSVTVVSKTLPAPAAATVITLGDSFTDGYGITRLVHDFISETAGATLNMIGLNDTGKAGVKDNAWSGQSYDWYYGGNEGYLRNDRPLSDARWDAGWGENEVNGWTTGQTWANLTNEQKAHGFTRNEFFNPAVSKFDFPYFMAARFPTYVPKSQAGPHVDSVLSFLGVNDSTFKDITALKVRLPILKERIDHIIASIHAFDPAIKIMLHLVTPQADNDSFMNTYGGFFSHGSRAKYAQEIWNSFMIANYDTPARVASNVFVVATNAHFDPVTGLITKVVRPNKFDQTIERVVTNDVHPTEIGSKYIADVARNFLLHKVLR